MMVRENDGNNANMAGEQQFHNYREQKRGEEKDGMERYKMVPTGS